jgi:SAM-dependent methyltransferase
MTRNEKILRHVSRAGRGIEIGPSYNPVAPKREGYDVKIIDALDREGLRAKYRTHPVSLEAIEEVDYVWRGEPYPELLGGAGGFDWIIASHLIEHTPDLIGFLNGCADILAPTGVLSLAIPDKRYCFDHFRPISGIGQVIDRHAAKARGHTAGSIAEFMLNAVGLDGEITWSSASRGRWEFRCPIDETRAQLREALKGPTGLDVHAWCFTPASFRLMIHDLAALDLIRLREISHSPTEGCEFFITLGANGAGPDCSRLDLLNQIGRELSAPAGA